jgi:N-acetylglutamate synthase-like GNAT family acetyltransferase
MVTVRDEFVPGSVWTPELRQDSVARMLALLASPEMQQAMDDAAESPDPNGAAAEFAGVAPPAPGRVDEPIDGAKCFVRRARTDDIPRMAQMMVEANLPPLFIEEWLPGFAAAEHEGELIACGGAEIYDGACVIRSIVVDPRARKLGLARRITELLIADAQAAGAGDAYLFTVEAHPFWKRLGFVDVALDQWKASPRQSWQYQFISTHPDAVEGVHSMWKRIDD